MYPFVRRRWKSDDCESSGAIKTAIRYALSGDAQGARMRARNAFARLWFTEHHKEAESAFAEKRAPRFHGR